MQETRSIELRPPDQVAYANVMNNSTDRSKDSPVSAPSEYQDLQSQHQENAGEYQELAPEAKTYENTKMEGQSKGETKNQNEQSQYEELTTMNDTHTYSGVSIS